MGDPRKHRKKYQTPSHPWIRSRLEEEAELMKEFKFGNKTEIWRAHSLLRTFASKAKQLIASEGKQSEIETQHLLDRLANLGLLEPNSKLDKVLDLNLKSLLDRRLQSQVFRKGFARTMSQARQFIVHKHIIVDDKVITSPAYLVSKKEESLIRFVPGSTLSDPNHPERVIVPSKSDKLELKSAKAQDKDAVKSEKAHGKASDKAEDKFTEKVTEKVTENETAAE